MSNINFDPTVEHYTKGSSADTAGLVRSNGANSQHFLGKEMNTSNLSTYHCDTYLATALDYARDKIDRKTTIKSGYRTSSSGTGASDYSEHMLACAADILPTDGWEDHDELFRVAFYLHNNASNFGIKGIGIYDYSADPDVSNPLKTSFIHIDVGRGTPGSNTREQRPARWYQWIEEEDDPTINYAVYFLGGNISYFTQLQQGQGDPGSYLSPNVYDYGLVADLITGGGSSGNYHPSFVNYPERTKLLQSYLKYRGFYSGSVDGDYGPGTANGVESFQTGNNLSADGIIVWNSGNTFPKMFPTLRRGHKESTNAAFNLNKNIRFLQTRLGVSADGDYGSGTEAAVEAIQGPGADGICGPATWQELADRV